MNTYNLSNATVLKRALSAISDIEFVLNILLTENADIAVLHNQRRNENLRKSLIKLVAKDSHSSPIYTQSSEIFQVKAFVKLYEEEMLRRRILTILLQMFC